MRSNTKQIVLEENLHDAFDDLELSLKAIVLTSVRSVFPEEMTKKLVNSIVDAIEEAQKDTCVDCPLNGECEADSDMKNKFLSMRYDSMRADMERIKEKEEPIIITPTKGMLN